MMSYVIPELLLGNTELLALKISALSNSVKNLSYLAIILIMLIYRRINLIVTPFIVITCMGQKANILPALTNTLFSIHPPLLYFSIIWVIVIYVYQLRSSRIPAVSILFFSMFLGGYWSMQELSWGGWWNWDVLECGIGYLWLFSVFFLHSKRQKSRSSSTLQCFYILSIWCVYTGLNKFGLATSIHSFVASKSSRIHYSAIILLITIATISILQTATVYSIPPLLIVVISYLWLQWCIFFKKPIILFGFYTVICGYYYRTALTAYHAIIKYILLFFIVFNYLNLSQFYSHNYRFTMHTITSTGSLWSFCGQSEVTDVFVWKQMVLSKPRYLLDDSFASNSSRYFFSKHLLISFTK